MSRRCQPGTDLVPDAPRHRCYLAPWLPDWLEGFAVHDVVVGDATVDVTVTRSGDRVHADAHATNELEIVLGSPPAPLWGAPMRASQIDAPATRPS